MSFPLCLILIIPKNSDALSEKLSLILDSEKLIETFLKEHRRHELRNQGGNVRMLYLSNS